MSTGEGVVGGLDMPSRLEPLRLALMRIGLPVWFGVIDLIWLARPEVFGIDARHYQRASSLWLAGGDPWTAREGGIAYAAGPHTLLMYAPTSFLPLELSVLFWTTMGLVAAIWMVRHFKLPMWWLAFPPLVHAIWNGNPQTLALALLVLGGSAAATGAVFIKLYAAVPLLWRPRSLLIALIALIVTLPILPWQLYLQDGFGIGNHLATAWNGSAWRIPILVPPTLLGLWILRREGGEWLSVPAAWPATQFYYVAMAFPLAIRMPVLAAFLAVPLPLVTPAAVMILAGRKVWREGWSALAIRPAGAPRSGSSPGSLDPPIPAPEPARSAATDS